MVIREDGPNFQKNNPVIPKVPEKGGAVSNQNTPNPESNITVKKPGINFLSLIVALSITFLIMYYLGAFEVFAELFDDFSQSFAGSGGSGYCTTDSDCYAFGGRNCAGSQNARCGSDNLCHCCLTFCPGGTNCNCLTCATGCGGGTYCERNVCLFTLGGYTSQ